ncbi:MAG TPA: DUF5681 domain-containing protein [Rhizomicrobium sp.]|nr:DUF5681 domain-containing protein [Rhizomicrobium sp.]
MSESPPKVGYGRPPVHTRFQKGQSGNPGGRPGPKKQIKRAFDAALGDALKADKQELRDARPRKVIEVMARKVALDALDGRFTAMRLVLAILDREDDDERRAAAEMSADTNMKVLLGDRYEEFTARFQNALATGAGDELATIAREFQALEKIPQSGNS